MPYRIYTYEDPYKLDQTDFWEEISVLPHFCSTRALVNGLKAVLGDRIRGLICELDLLIEHKNVYGQWAGNLRLQIEQYSMLSSCFKEICKEGINDEAFYKALQHNQNHFLEAIRLFIELDIKSSALDETEGNPEQQFFVHVLKKVQDDSLFRFPSAPDHEELKEALCVIASQEAKQCRGSERERKRCEEAAKLTKQNPLSAVVVHGVQHFSPVQLRLLLALEKMGITIIFLFNYQKKYSQIYSPWIRLYECFGVPPHHDTAVREYEMPAMQTPGNALACVLGELWEGRNTYAVPHFRSWHQLYKSIELTEFASVAEYAQFVSNCFEEQVYTANYDVHKLLKIYYPECAKDRHFLSYAIGRFFSAIYRLWDYERREIMIDTDALKDCLSSNLLKAASGEVLLRTFCNVDILFEHITTFDEFKREIAEEYVEKYDRVIAAKSANAVSQLKQLAIYNKCRVTKKDLSALIRAIKEINKIATCLFALDHSREEFVDLGEHFKKLEKFLKQGELDMAREQERALINALQLRLDKIKPGPFASFGTFRILKEGLCYYLKQKNDEEERTDWYVKNFEQIDGDILQSKYQFDCGKKISYHFACLSDRDMKSSVNGQLPWPLTEAFMRRVCSPVDLRLRVYYTALEERSGFLRYALFYGLYFNHGNAHLSYVKQYGEKGTSPYTLLSALGLVPKTKVMEQSDERPLIQISVPQVQIKELLYDRYQMMDMFLCPYRFFLDYVVEDAPTVQNHYLYQKYYENLLVDAVWKRIGGQPRAEAIKYLDRILKQESKRYEPYFKFWTSTERYDLRLRARNYLEYAIIPRGFENLVPVYAPSHMEMRKLFGSAKFVVDISKGERKNPYDTFEQLAKRSFHKKEYSLHRLPKPEARPREQLLAEELCNEAENYINQTNGKNRFAIPSDWCTYCTHKGKCMAPYGLSE